MKRIVIAAAIALSASAAPAQTIAMGDAAALAKALTDMGYKPGVITSAQNTPRFTVEIASVPTMFAFGGCVAGKNCKYVLLLSVFANVANPPADWINRQNGELDTIKVWVGADRATAFSTSIQTGGEPLRVATLRFVVEQWKAAIDHISQSAIKEKLIK